jgi:phage terminase large subunit-like protein
LLAFANASESRAFFHRFSDAQKEELKWSWAFWGRPKQQLPPGDWFVWLVLAGRGFGNNRTPVENVSKMLRGPTPLIAPPGAPKLMTVVADRATTYADSRSWDRAASVPWPARH